ncbi:MAG TPA: MFS transporter [Thermomicrobiaceae bacterium]|nr:MFS transporter [Thermomicrobiaceae bacterium]
MRDDGAETMSWRRNLYVLWVGETLTILGFSMCYPFLPFYLADLGARSFASQALWSGALLAASAGFMTIASPLWGMAADRYGRKPMLVRAMCCGAVTTGLMGLVVAPWQLLILFILDGALSGTVSAAMTLVAATTPKERMGYALGLLQTAVFTGISLGPLVGGVLADRIGYRPVFGLGSVLLIIAALLALTLTRERFVRAPRGAAAGVDDGREARLLAIFLAGAVPAAIGILFALRLATAAVTPILPLFVERLSRTGAPVASLTGLTFGVSGIGSALAALSLGRAADRLGPRRVLTVSGLAVALLFVPLALVQSPWQLIVCYGLLGVATGGIGPSALAVVSDLTPAARRGLVFGVTSAAASLGGFIGPFGGSLVAANFDLRLVFLLGSGEVLAFTLWLGLTLRGPQAGASESADSGQPHPAPP